ncbi:MAG: TRAP transporter small permease subunit [Rhodocyclaceae bacterium]|nr:TRAP transporter small permease subunit [Rhodocyclaceae bacterium]
MTAGRATSAAAWADRLLGRIAAAGLVLVLPLSLLLFLQWPLREWLQAGSREANDLAQILFALYVAVAVNYATRRHAHLAADAWAHRYAPATRWRLARIAALCASLPWSLFVLYATGPSVAQSFGQLESFPETFNPGYFLVRAAVALAAVLVAAQSLLDVWRDPQRR